MGSKEIATWADASKAFEIARDELKKTIASAASTINALQRKGFMHPKGASYVPGDPISGNGEFDPQQWPTGEGISDALKRTLLAYRTLSGAWKALSPDDKQIVHATNPPEM